jgi:hypothetical protein
MIIQESNVKISIEIIVIYSKKLVQIFWKISNHESISKQNMRKRSKYSTISTTQIDISSLNPLLTSIN